MAIGGQAQHRNRSLGSNQRQGLRSHPVLQLASRWTHCAAQQGGKKCITGLRTGQSLQECEGKCDAEATDRQLGHQLCDGTVAEGGGVNCTEYFLDCWSGDIDPGCHLLLGSMSGGSMFVYCYLSSSFLSNFFERFAWEIGNHSNENQEKVSEMWQTAFSTMKKIICLQQSQDSNSIKEEQRFFLSPIRTRYFALLCIQWLPGPNENVYNNSNHSNMISTLSINQYILLQFIYNAFAVIMNKSELFDSSIAEEQFIIGINLQQQPNEHPRYKLRFASIAEIKNYQRLANIRNLKLVETCPAFFNQNDIRPNQRHFIAKRDQQYFLNGLNKEETSDVIAKREKKWEILIDTSNIQQQSILKIELSNFKRIRTFTLETKEVEGSKTIGYRYTFNKVENSLVVRVWLELDGAFKVWKEMELPVSQSNITIQIHQVNNQQTDVRINDYLFHLLLKMPYYRQAHFWLLHEDAAEIEIVEVRTVRQQKYYEDTQTNCSNECQLI